MTILYPVGQNLYVNMTNRCPCACTFCLREHGDSVYGSDPLWLEREPTVQEVCDEFKKWDLTTIQEVVFCGYGEPTERLEDLLAVAKFLKETQGVSIRINTNGLSDLMHQKPTAPMLKGLVDTVSISLNADNAEEFLAVTRSKFGLQSFDAMLKFAADCTHFVPQVVLTIVDTVTTPKQQQRCLAIANSVGATLRIRPLES